LSSTPAATAAAPISSAAFPNLPRLAMDRAPSDSLEDS
jgi:hypothetical protein